MTFGTRLAVTYAALRQEVLTVPAKTTVLAKPSSLATTVSPPMSSAARPMPTAEPGGVTKSATGAGSARIKPSSGPHAAPSSRPVTSAEPGPAGPGLAEPEPAEPGPAEPVPAEPGPAEPGPAEPGPAGPTEPGPAWPVPARPPPAWPPRAVIAVAGCRLLPRTARCRRPPLSRPRAGRQRPRDHLGEADLLAGGGQPRHDAERGDPRRSRQRRSGSDA